MPDTYAELFYHLVWKTKLREPMISAEIEPHLYRCIRHRCEQLRTFVYALDGTADHVHLACSIPPTLPISEFLEKIKGGSSHFINHLEDERYRLYWQPGYGALTFSKRDLPRVVSYIENQKRHHAEGSLSPKMERISESTP